MVVSEPGNRHVLDFEGTAVLWSLLAGKLRNVIFDLCKI
jgi:hypothetical protein